MKVRLNVSIDVESKEFLHDNPEINASEILNKAIKKLIIHTQNIMPITRLKKERVLHNKKYTL